MNEQEPPCRLAIPYGLSVLATRDMHGYVPGIQDIMNGYTRSDGTKELSVEEKMKRGRTAVYALMSYRNAKKAKSAMAILSLPTRWYLLFLSASGLSVSWWD